jgi:hypothetical protein
MRTPKRFAEPSCCLVALLMLFFTACRSPATSSVGARTNSATPRSDITAANANRTALQTATTKGTELLDSPTLLVFEPYQPD